jgi:hypothetical protein
MPPVSPALISWWWGGGRKAEIAAKRKDISLIYQEGDVARPLPWPLLMGSSGERVAPAVQQWPMAPGVSPGNSRLAGSRRAWSVRRPGLQDPAAAPAVNFPPGGGALHYPAGPAARLPRRESVRRVRWAKALQGAEEHPRAGTGSGRNIRPDAPPGCTAPHLTFGPGAREAD